MKIIITGSNGLIGSEAVRHFGSQGHQIIGIDSNLRKFFFGEAGDTSWSLNELKNLPIAFEHHSLDIRDRANVLELYKSIRPDATIHCAAQPSHDLAAKIPFEDFDTNAGGTINLLEANRQFSAESPFVYMSTNKVYGDAINELALVETEKRFDFKDENYHNGIDENMRIDQTKHSLFGASKTAGDIIAQEYGQYFNMPVASFRGGCLTGPSHAGVELHGFLSYLVKVAVLKGKYTIYGYKGKQVRDQIHASDVVRAFEAYITNPIEAGVVYNLGGGKNNSASILECIDLIYKISGIKLDYSLSDQNRIGDHICYYTNLSKFKQHYWNWDIQIGLEAMIKEMIEAENQRFKA